MLAAVREGDTLVAPSLGRLARSVSDAHSIGNLLAERKVVLRLGENEFDPADPVGDMFFRTLGTVADFTSEVQRLRTSEGLAVARAKGKLRGRVPKLSNLQEREVRRMAATGQYTIADIAEIFNVARSTIYRTFKRADPSAHN